MMRVLGKDGMASAYQGDNGGFAGPDVVKAWKLYKELCDLDSFQEGFQTMKTRDATAFFHDGKTAFHPMGTWVLTAGRLYAADKKGLPEANLGWLFFPEVQGSNGKANDIFGSVYLIFSPVAFAFSSYIPVFNLAARAVLLLSSRASSTYKGS